MTGSQVWGESWFRDTGRHMEMPAAWRGILTEYFAASLKLVDDADELQVLEQLLESNTPTLHSNQEDKHAQVLAYKTSVKVPCFSVSAAEALNTR